MFPKQKDSVVSQIFHIYNLSNMLKINILLHKLGWFKHQKKQKIKK